MLTKRTYQPNRLARPTLLRHEHGLVRLMRPTHAIRYDFHLFSAPFSAPLGCFLYREYSHVTAAQTLLLYYKATQRAAVVLYASRHNLGTCIAVRLHEATSSMSTRVLRRRACR
jgi:hypothetical protein